MKESIINRNNAFVSIIEKLPDKKQLIFQLIKENAPCTAWEVSEKYLIPINEVVARITDLKNECLVIEEGSKENKYTGKQNTLYRSVKDLNERIDLINEIFIQLRDTRDKFINDNNLGLSDLTRFIVDKEIKKYNRRIKKLERTLELNLNIYNA